MTRRRETVRSRLVAGDNRRCLSQVVMLPRAENRGTGVAAPRCDGDNAVVEHVFCAGLELQKALAGGPCSTAAGEIRTALAMMDQAIKELRWEAFMAQSVDSTR